MKQSNYKGVYINYLRINDPSDVAKVYGDNYLCSQSLKSKILGPKNFMQKSSVQCLITMSGY
jgi:hypothetical protein